MPRTDSCCLRCDFHALEGEDVLRHAFETGHPVLLPPLHEGEL